MKCGCGCTQINYFNKGGEHQFVCNECNMQTPACATKEEAAAIWEKAFGVLEKLKEVAETGVLPDGDHVNLSTKMWLEGLMEAKS